MAGTPLAQKELGTVARLERLVGFMQIAIYGEQSDDALVKHLRNLIYPALEKFTNSVEKVTLFWKSETLNQGSTQYWCCLHLSFFNHQYAETTYWDEDLSEAARRSADLAARLAARCCAGDKNSRAADLAGPSIPSIGAAVKPV